MRTTLVLLGLAAAASAPCSSASAQWQLDGSVVCAASNEQRDPVSVPDGAGGAVLAWSDSRGGDGDIYVQRLSASGVPLWTPDGVPLCTVDASQQDPRIVSDGAGGAIVAWEDARVDPERDVYAQRVNAAGVPQWAAGGVPLATATGAQVSLAIASDGAGGAIVAWRDHRNGADYDVYARRVDATGNVLWAADGVALAPLAGDQTIPEILADGQGGAFVAWFDRRSSPDADVYAQRVNASGALQWTPNGVAVCATAGVQRNPRLVTDGSGGVIVTWWDTRNGSDFDIYARRVDASGTPQWTANGVALCTATGDQQSSTAVSDGAGGAIVVWNDFRTGTDWDIYARRVGAAGTAVGAADGIPICTATGDQVDIATLADGAGGAIVSWSDTRVGESDIYAQRIDATGGRLWAVQGQLLCAATGDQITPATAPDGSGGAIVVWGDARAGSSADIYAQRIRAGGGTLTAAHAVVPRAFFALSSNAPNPFASTTVMHIDLPTAAEIAVELYDAMGRRVREIGRPPLGAGQHALTFDGLDDTGRPLASGVYFYRVTSNGTTLSRKLVVSR